MPNSGFNVATLECESQLRAIVGGQLVSSLAWLDQLDEKLDHLLGPADFVEVWVEVDVGEVCERL